MHFTLGENVYFLFFKSESCWGPPPSFFFFWKWENNLDVVALLVQLSDHFVGHKILHIAVLSMEC